MGKIMEQKMINSFDGTPINVRIWDEATTPKGIVQISHDIGEHSGKYVDFAKILQDVGYIVFCPDLRGFGLTEPKDSLGYHDGDVFKDSVQDVIFLSQHFSRVYNLPIFLLGIGYGSFLTQSALEHNISSVGVILASSGYIDKITSEFGKIALKFLPKKKKSLLFSTYNARCNSRYKTEKGQKLWLTADETMRNEFLSDSLCDLTPSNHFCYSLTKGLSDMLAWKDISEQTKNTPLAFFVGRQDPHAGKNASKVITLYKKYRKIGFSSVRLFIYEKARHNVLHEVDRKCYVNHMLGFINRCFVSHVVSTIGNNDN